MNLHDALLSEIARVSELAGVYKTLGPGGAPALFLMRQDLETAKRAMSDMDAVQEMRSLESLKGWTD